MRSAISRAWERPPPCVRQGRAAPKEQPPRKLSGKRTAREHGPLESGRPRRWAGAPPKGTAWAMWSHGRKLSGSMTEGAGTGRAIVAGREPSESAPVSELKRTPLYDLHRELGARIVPFAGWEMPVQYPAGILAEHLHCRAAAGAVRRLPHGPGRVSTGPSAAAALERLVPGDIRGLAPGRARYTLFTNRRGRHPRRPDRQQRGRPSVPRRQRRLPRCATSRHLRAGLEPAMSVIELADRALLALQGPAAATVLAGAGAGAAPRCRSWARPRWTSAACPAGSRASATPARTASRSRSPAEHAERLARTLLGQTRWRRPASAPAIRCGSRPACASTATTSTRRPRRSRRRSPGRSRKRRRDGGRLPGRRGDPARSSRDGAVAQAVGMKPEGKAPAREGTEIQARPAGAIGKVTSGGFGADRRRAGGHGLCRDRRRRAGHRAGPHRPRQAAARPRHRPALRPPPLPPLSTETAMATFFTKDHEWVRIDGDTATVGISRARPGAAGRCRVRRAAGGRPRGNPGRAGGRGRERQGRQRDLCADRRRGASRATRRSERARRWSTRTPRARAGSSSCALADAAQTSTV